MIFAKKAIQENKIDKAREFIVKVQEIAKEYGLPYFIVTDGASAYSNNGCNAVRHARECHIEWEKEHGHDPYEDWSDKKDKYKK